MGFHHGGEVNAHISLEYTPRAWQRGVHLGLHDKRWGVLVSHRRSGKTVLAVMHLIDRACRLTRPDGRYAYIAPLLSQGKSIAWHYLKRYALKIPGTTANESELHVTLPNGARIRIHGGDQPDSLRGLYMDGVILDEAADLKPDLWESVIRPQLADRNGWALFMGTPKGTNLLSRMYFDSAGKDDWYRGRFTVNDTDSLPEDEVRSLKADMAVSKFNREFLCDFNAAVDNILLSVDEVETASKRAYQAGDFQHAAKVIGVDVARQGDDATVIIRRQGLMCWAPHEMRGADAMQVADRVAYEINEWSPDAVMIDGTGGYGAGVIDRLRQLGHRVIEVQFAGKPNSEKYLNKRAEMWYEMAEWIKQAGCLPPGPRLKEDLCTPTYAFNQAGKMVLESKEDIKGRGLPSTDHGDALAVTFSQKVIPQGLSDVLGLYREPVKQRPYNPLGKVGGYGR